jgi:hypothetical protein
VLENKGKAVSINMGTAFFVEILRGSRASHKQHGTNSSETSNMIGVGFGKPYQLVWLGFGKWIGERGSK